MQEMLKLLIGSCPDSATADCGGIRSKQSLNAEPIIPRETPPHTHKLTHMDDLALQQQQQQLRTLLCHASPVRPDVKGSAPSVAPTQSWRTRTLHRSNELYHSCSTQGRSEKKKQCCCVSQRPVSICRCSRSCS